MKPGFITSEFCTLLGGFAATVLNQKLGLNIDATPLAAMFCSIAAYIASRTWLKSKAAPAPEAK